VILASNGSLFRGTHSAALSILLIKRSKAALSKPVPLICNRTFHARIPQNVRHIVLRLTDIWNLIARLDHATRTGIVRSQGQRQATKAVNLLPQIPRPRIQIGHRITRVNTQITRRSGHKLSQPKSPSGALGLGIKPAFLMDQRQEHIARQIVFLGDINGR
jgi:hypothetical protein